MRVKVLLFAALADKAGGPFFDFENINSLDQLIALLVRKFPFLENTRFAVAVNQSLVRGNTKLNDNDEVALLPPFAGG